ncbi:MAG: diacylglycerol/lipid kinase family protein [Spirochaetales bacterium]
MSEVFWQELVRELARLIASSRCYRREPLSVYAVVNPRAGVLSRKRTRKRLVELLRRRLDDKAISPAAPPDIRVALTEYSGHARQLAERAADYLAGRRQTLLLSAGGDGTHRDLLSGVLSRRLKAPVYRLPAGTGNDSADAPTLADAFERASDLAVVTPQMAIEVRSFDGAVYHAFNVASFGLDAVISGVTNRLKTTRVPGNMYTVVADIATLLYVPLVGIPPARIVWREGPVQHEVSGQFALAALGAGGNRRYGGGKPILPDYRNLCIIRLPPFAQRVSLKRHLYQGTHLERDGVIAGIADSVTIYSDQRLPFQFDGEMVWIEPGAFPVHMTIIRDAWLSVQTA